MLAQQSLNLSLENFLSASRKLIPRFLPYLKKSDNHTHEQFKVSALLQV